MARRESLTTVAVENLDLSIRDLADQLQVLRDVVDEIREDVSWATRNAMVVALPSPGDRHGIPLGAASPRKDELVIQAARIPKLGTISGVDAVVQTVSDVTDQVSAATIGLAWVRDEIKQTLDSAEVRSMESMSHQESSTPSGEEPSETTGNDIPQDAARASPSVKPGNPARVQRSLFDDDGDDHLGSPNNSESVPASSDEGIGLLSSPTAGDVLCRESRQPGGVDSLTDEHRRSNNRFDEAINTLCEALAAGQSEQLKTFLTTLGRFHQYSFGNILLISLQRPDATRVAGFGTWKKLGRRVRKGEKGIAILAPVAARRRKNESNDETGEVSVADAGPDADTEAKIRPVGFRTVHVFDVSQTDGDPLPEFPSVQGDPGALLDRLKTSIESHGIQLVEEAISGGALGVSTGGTILIRPGLQEAEHFKTLVHECAHELLHKNERRSQTTKTIRETEAEAVAFAVCHAAGFDMNTSSSDYIQLYNGSTETLMTSLDHIRRCTDIILRDILPDVTSASTNEAD